MSRCLRCLQILLVIVVEFTCSEVIETEGLTLAWEDISLELQAGKERFKLLHGICGEARAGRLLAVMGPSGSGKTSFLNVISGTMPLTPGAVLEGKVTLNGCDAGPLLGKSMAYVQQKQDFYPYLTTRETLLFATGMRMGHLSKAEKSEYVSELLDKLGLSHAANTQVGDSGGKIAGISGGEQRRLALALGLVGLRSPSVLLVDEPTSGLDAAQAQQVMQTIRSLCRAEGHTCVVTIHQPRSSIYHLFDDLMLISEGRSMYTGPVEDALPHFESLGYTMPKNYNPADFLVDIISPRFAPSHNYHVGIPQSSRERFETIASASAQQWRAFRSNIPPERLVKNTRRGTRLLGEAVILTGGHNGNDHTETTEKVLIDLHKAHGRSPAGPLAQFRLLLTRSWRQASRDPTALIARIVGGLTLGGVFGSVFWGLGWKEIAVAKAVSNRFSLLVNVIMNISMVGSIRALQTLAIERPIIARERRDEGYSVIPFLLAKLVAEMPSDTVFPLFLGPTVYMSAGLGSRGGTWKKFSKYMGFLMLQAQASNALGLMVGCLSPSADIATMLGPAINVVFLMLCGVHSEMPPFLKKFENISTIKWGVQGLVNNDLAGMLLPIGPEDKKAVTSGTTIRPSKHNKGKMLFGLIPQGPPAGVTGEEILEGMGYSSQSLWRPFKWLSGITVACHCITLLVLAAAEPKFQKLEHHEAKSEKKSSCHDTTPRSVPVR